jgi:hypothetical protein
MSDSTNPESKKSLGGLLGSLPDLVSRLIRGEIALAKAELVASLKEAGIGIGILVAAALFGFLLLEVLVAAAVLATATVFPGWLAALLVAAALLVVTGILALVGIRRLKRRSSPIPTGAVSGVKADVQAVKGEGHHGNPTA